MNSIEKDLILVVSNTVSVLVTFPLNRCFRLIQTESELRRTEKSAAEQIGELKFNGPIVRYF